MRYQDKTAQNNFLKNKNIRFFFMTENFFEGKFLFVLLLISQKKEKIFF